MAPFYGWGSSFSKLESQLRGNSLLFTAQSPEVPSTHLINFDGRGFSSDKIIPIYFLRLSKVWSILHHGSVWRVHKKCYLLPLCTFLAFFRCFHHKICVFIIFISFFFFDKVFISTTEY